jgi:hypothetical protein
MTPQECYKALQDVYEHIKELEKTIRTKDSQLEQSNEDIKELDKKVCQMTELNLSLANKIGLLEVLEVQKIRLEEGMREKDSRIEELLVKLREEKKTVRYSFETGPKFVNPDWNEMKKHMHVWCSCGLFLVCQVDIREHWQLGHFGKWE